MACDLISYHAILGGVHSTKSAQPVVQLGTQSQAGRQSGIGCGYSTQRGSTPCLQVKCQGSRKRAFPYLSVIILRRFVEPRNGNRRRRSRDGGIGTNTTGNLSRKPSSAPTNLQMFHGFRGAWSGSAPSYSTQASPHFL